MSFLNVEIKARCQHPDQVRDWLLSHNARFVGTDQQTDTYYVVPEGRLKLREGNIENNLIFYRRPDQEGPKSSAFTLMPVSEPEKLKEILGAVLSVKIVVEKKREIYYIDNVKFHIDLVPGLGSFMEIEAGNMLAPDLSETELRRQCDDYMEKLTILPADLLQHSYSELLLANHT